MEYPVRLTKDDNDTFLVEFPDIPEAVTFGDTKDEALVRAQDALATAIEAYIKDRRPIPVPSVTRGLSVALPALVDAKVTLYRLMQEQHIGKAELGRRLNWHLPQVDRLLDVHHGSQLDQLESAFRVLGKLLVLTVHDTPRPQVMRATRSRGVHAGVLTAARAARGDTGRRVVVGHRSSKRASKKR